MSAYTLDAQQEMLADSARNYLSRRAMPKHDATQADRQSNEAARWAQMADLGWLALPVSEAFGGLGGSMADICALAEELGRGLVNEPYIASAVLAGMLLADVAPQSVRNDWLPALADGSRRLALAAWEPGARSDWTEVNTRATQDGAYWRLDGNKVLVLGGTGADGLLVSAKISGSSDFALFLLPSGGPGQRWVAQILFDGQGAAELTMQAATGATLLYRGEPSAVLGRLEVALDRATLAHCADTVGAMARAFALTREYLGTRSQFGKPIAANQVVQHRLVDLFVEIEEARSLMRMTASLYADTGIDKIAAQRRHVAATKAFVAQVARHVWEESVQLHGAIGMTQEYEVGAYVKRLALAVNLYGDATFHLERVACSSLDSSAIRALKVEEKVTANHHKETTSAPSS
ncbi:acyl-CoA dehydrogenase family protein [Limnohabitans sp. Rim8]|uniref:acyl-CoA dehydrogenase family protein n=1 Tax=Limnohabitans sp. Rim8 TaxID=1100718 RepID=UPI00263477F4|nr:acyl-CoA dehydrogenase family protein [Limnohabitans sp. Rim8]